MRTASAALNAGPGTDTVKSSAYDTGGFFYDLTNCACFAESIDLSADGLRNPPADPNVPADPSVPPPPVPHRT